VSQIIKFIADNIKGVKELEDLSNIKLGSVDIHNMAMALVLTHPYSFTINAFKKMADKGVSGMPVVDDKSCLLGSLSNSDLRTIGCNAERWSTLFSSVGKFLKMESDLFKDNKIIGKDSLTYAETDSMGSVIHKIADNHLHRIYFVDKHHKLLGVCSLIDLVKLIA